MSPENREPKFVKNTINKSKTTTWVKTGICAGLLIYGLFALARFVSGPKSSETYLKDLPADLAGEKQKLEKGIVQNPKDASLFHRLGNVDAKLKLMDEAQLAYENEIALDPASAGAYLNLGNIYFFKADKNPRNLDQVIAYYSQSVVLEPNSVEGHFDLAYALYVKKDNSAALGQLDEVIKLDPKNEYALELKKQIKP